MLSFLRTILCALALCLMLSSPAYASTHDQFIPWKISKNDLKHLKNAAGWAKKRNWNEAILHASRASDPLIKDIFLWYQYTQPNTKNNFQDVAEFIQTHRTWPKQTSLLASLERSIDSETPPQHILDWYSNHSKADQPYRIPVSKDGKLALANAIIGMQDSAQSEGKQQSLHNFINILLADIWINNDFTNTEEWEFLSQYRSYLTTQDHAQRINKLLWNNQLSAAKRLIHHVDQRYQRLFDARLKLRSNSYGIDDAIAALSEDDLADSGFLYDRIMWRDRRNRQEGVLELLKNAPKNDAYAKRWWRIKKKYISRLLDQQDYSTAYTLASKHGFSPTGEYANRALNAEGEWLAGWIAYGFLYDYRTAYRHFSKLHQHVSTPISLARTSYWSYLSASENRNHDIAQKWLDIAVNYPTTFYGQLALEKSGQSDVSLHEAPPPNWVDKSHFANNTLMKAAYYLYRARLASVALSFSRKAAKDATTQGEQQLIARLSTHFGQLDHGVIIAKNALRHNGNILSEYLYPLIKKVEEEQYLPVEKDLIHAIIMQESNFKVSARSHAGAMGLMQLMPATAKEVARKIKVKYQKKRLLSDSYYNILLGSHYLNYLLKLFDGSYPLAIAAYNGGQGNVRKWIKKHGDPRDFTTNDEIVLWIEKIPFPETRNYVQRVMENLSLFNYRLSNDAELTLKLPKKLLSGS